LVDPNSAGRGTEPHKAGAETSNHEYRHSLCDAARHLSRFLTWLGRWWRGKYDLQRTSNFTGLLALATLALAFVNFFMLMEMRSAAIDTRHAIDAVNRLATAAEEQAGIANAALTGLERPYVTAEFGPIPEANSDWFSGAASLRQEFDVVNWGRSPAILTRVTCNQARSDDGKFTDKYLRKLYDWNLGSKFVIGPGGRKALYLLGRSHDSGV
jgi:hypothetical protein